MVVALIAQAWQGQQAPATMRADVQGPARVVDGDTLDVAGTKVRLLGIDAPESRQTCEAQGRDYACGQRAREALAELIGGRTVACEKHDQDRYGRVVGVCHAGGQDLNAALVAAGWALAYREYSRAYVDEEKAAREARRGMWQGRFENPADYRKKHR